MKSAFGLGTARPHGRTVVQHSRLAKEDCLGTTPETWLFGSHFRSFPLDADADEEIYIQNNRLVWSCSGVVRKQFTTGQNITKAAWVHFAETGSHPLLCMLQPTLLTIYSLGGELHSVPLACKFTQIWPLPRGLILAGSSQVSPCLVTHPLEALQAMPVQGHGSMHSHDNVLWTSTAVPYMATWCPIPRSAGQVCSYWCSGD